MINTVGSVCSGIEAASVAWEPFGVIFNWFSEIADFPSRLLSEKYPDIPNLGDMNNIPDMLYAGEAKTSDLICGGTPCQAFSYAGWQNGLNDDRGNLTLKFVDIIDANDKMRLSEGLDRGKVFWENVEGVLTDKTNAFGCFISSLAGLSCVLEVEGNRWPSAGLLFGNKRNVGWRVLDAKYFGLPQQRRRLYVVAGGKDFNPGAVLFELHTQPFEAFPSYPLTFEKDGHTYEVFREYTDCLYSAYGTKWNGNAAANNGSLFVVQDGRIRRFSPLETERLMGFPDNYTDLKEAKKTNRYQATGNSWAVPVVQWLGKRLIDDKEAEYTLNLDSPFLQDRIIKLSEDEYYINLGKNETIRFEQGRILNCSYSPEHCLFTGLKDIVSPDAPEDIYISPVGCYGIIRRQIEHNSKINPRLEEILLKISSQMTPEEIEKRSRKQHRGRLGDHPYEILSPGNDPSLIKQDVSSLCTSQIHDIKEITNSENEAEQLSFF